MSDRINAGARVPEKILDQHVENVREKWGREGVYLGTEADRAIREYLDKDDLAELEDRLRERCTPLSTSTEKIKSSVNDSGEGMNPRAMWRVHPELKKELKGYAKETDNTYSDLFALAIREYWTNSRSERIKKLYDRLETAIEPFEDSIGEEGESASVVDRRTAGIARQLPDSKGYRRSDVEEAIAEVTSGSEYNLEKYTPLVMEYMGLDEHPKNPDLFIPHEEAAEYREETDIGVNYQRLFERSYDDLDADERDLRVCTRLYRNAMSSRNGKAQMGHKEIAAEFGGDAGQTTIYNIMDRAGDRVGFEVANSHGVRKVRVQAEYVDDPVIEAATEIEADGKNQRSQSGQARQAVTDGGEHASE